MSEYTSALWTDENLMVLLDAFDLEDEVDTVPDDVLARLLIEHIWSELPIDSRQAALVNSIIHRLQSRADLLAACEAALQELLDYAEADLAAQESGRGVYIKPHDSIGMTTDRLREAIARAERGES